LPPSWTRASSIRCPCATRSCGSPRYFPAEACEPFAVEALHPDTFLLDLYGLDSDHVFDVVARQAAVLSRPPMTTSDLLDRLAATVPDFAQALRAKAV
jgi:hypothetical protein